MKQGRRARRFGAALALTGVLLTQSSLFPARLTAAAAPAPASITLTQFCDAVARAIAFLEKQPPSPLRDFLLRLLLRTQEARCKG